MPLVLWHLKQIGTKIENHHSKKLKWKWKILYAL